MKQLVCPSCHALNRADEARLGQAVCGACAKPLAEGGVLHLDAPLLDRLLAKDGLPLLVDFWAPWCGPCKKMAPAFEEAARLLAPGVRLGKVDTEGEKGLGARFQVQSIPTLVLFRGGRELARVSGARPASEINAWTRGQLGGQAS
ncbi:MAG: thioredoxin TrxC [Desulfovibrio sp.]|nr:thioredoxin TrxC [Desulfovibrio sp.]